MLAPSLPEFFHVLFFSLTVEPTILNETVHFNEPLMEGQTATFTCVADGYPLSTVVWLHNSTFVTTGNATRRRIFLSDPTLSPRHDYINAHSSTLQVSGLRLRDTGQYRCRVDPAIIDKGTSSISPILDLTVLSGAIFECRLIVTSYFSFYQYHIS